MNEKIFNYISQRDAPDVLINDINIKLNDKLIFDKLNTKFLKGQWTCILGPSGCGKSTLLKSIAGIIHPESGFISDENKTSLRGKVSWMDQKDLLVPWLSVQKNIEIGYRLRGDIIDSKISEQLIEEVGLKESKDLLPDVLSGGMRQRVALARTLMENKPLVLMDEPFSAVDAITRSKLQALAANLLKGRTVILVTHDPWEALRLGNRILIINNKDFTKSEYKFELDEERPRNLSNRTVATLANKLLEQLEEASS